jgi:hypothetical protein
MGPNPTCLYDQGLPVQVGGGHMRTYMWVLLRTPLHSTYM